VYSPLDLGGKAAALTARGDGATTTSGKSKGGRLSARGSGSTGTSTKALTALVDDTDVVHTGEIFFALPNGSALVYNLNGVPSAPGPEDTVSCEVQRGSLFCSVVTISLIPLPLRYALYLPPPPSGTVTTPVETVF
jgi:hypothetical protein